MDVDGATINSAAGGEAEAAGFMVSAGGNTVLGFSLTGATIDGCGTLVELELDGEATGLSGIIISDSNGEQIPFEYFDGSGGGEDPYCGDGECNGDEDEGSCPEDCETGRSQFQGVILCISIARPPVGVGINGWTMTSASPLVMREMVAAFNAPVL